MQTTKKHSAGFTLIELMIVIAIIAIIAAIGYPSYQGYITKSRRADAKSILMQAMQAQQRGYTANSTYETDLTNLGYSVATDLPSDNGYYQISAAACGTGISSCVQLTAAPQAPQTSDTECGDLTLDSRGTRGISGSGTVEKCW